MRSYRNASFRVFMLSKPPGGEQLHSFGPIERGEASGEPMVDQSFGGRSRLRHGIISAPVAIPE